MMKRLLRYGLLTAAVMTLAPLHQAEVATQVISSPRNVPRISKPVRVLRGRFTRDVVLTRDTFWVLRGTVFVQEPARLIIEPGTQIIGETATRGTLVIDRGAQILADGTREQPIVFTSDQPVGQRNRGDWGGLIINGRAPLNLPGGLGVGEGDTGIYGGTDPDDNSGILRFVRVEFAGIEFSPDNELNGIAFQGVGRGTIVDHIQVSFNKDNGIEMFGGSVDIKHAVLTNIGDDSVDWTFGWNGRMQFVVVQQRGDDGDKGIEADNNGNNNDLLPRSHPTIYNATFIGDPTTAFGAESVEGLRLREGTAGTLRNLIVMGFKTVGVNVANASTLQQVSAGALSLSHSIFFGNGTRNFGSGAATLIAANAATINEVDPRLIAPYSLTAPNFRPAPGSPALSLAPAIPPNDGFFEIALFRGALDVDPARDWTLGWTNFSAQ
jgi:hypothetical protein